MLNRCPKLSFLNLQNDLIGEPLTALFRIDLLCTKGPEKYFIKVH